MISWAIFQSFLLTPDQHDRQLFSARVANSIFIGGGLTLFVGMLSTALISTISGDILWTKAAIVVGKLEAYESTYTGGGLTLAAIEELAPYLAPLQNAVNTYTRLVFFFTSPFVRFFIDEKIFFLNIVLYSINVHSFAWYLF